MAKKTSANKTSTNSKSGTQSTTARGRLVEQIVATLHEEPGIKIQRNVRLPGRGTSNRRREIDILITRSVAGYPVQIAFECKNEKTPIGAPRIDEFIGKLDDVNIPCQYGIFVSASGYNPNGIERAKEKGIRPLTLVSGFSKKDLVDTVNEALQSLIYILPVIEEPLKINNFISSSYTSFLFLNENGEYYISAPDLIRQQWQHDIALPVVGKNYDVKVEIPTDFYQIDNGELKPSQVGTSVEAIVKPIALVITLKGLAQQYKLINAIDNTLERQQVKATFDNNNEVTKYPALALHTEEELEAFLKKPQASINITNGRFVIPRIKFGPLFWPISNRVEQYFNQQLEAIQAGRANTLDFAKIEALSQESLMEL
jgi:hypothetical protein